ncbi:hypothetical protein GUITHDRAFT_152470 [Guillardia theta CCMP2712]|uniref:Uncharacterized protein n=1 Tax=Guillardia theta (strain CCMP2712) TaxID=905079 RepID=L1JDH3_GUITC|nr:hypothetical protein GUITHDRAFT_152470 [Guillardia theta CCMP2712]EKX46327.1 hypothetical protein GUITHDRAFT_152470 [Guillardia theta CCMP2712]|mmetsp:Transcript_30918/g.99291  ORF Transcript_30918/g.99291 Transcript_30918/m.99291 type:complete len:211 (-) Transcript_30918:369-1001(-)|eukprot:XP_005833307.1 hypothetical protein GUITHDRAFT_152470 [Guillardia theta CCMP2712]
MLGETFSYSSSSSTSSSSQTGADGCYYTEQIERSCRTGSDGSRICENLKRFFRQCPGRPLEERRGEGSDSTWAPLSDSDHSSSLSDWPASPLGIFSRFSPFGGTSRFDGLTERAPYTESEETLPSDSSNFENRYYRRYFDPSTSADSHESSSVQTDAQDVLRQFQDMERSIMRDFASSFGFGLFSPFGRPINRPRYQTPNDFRHFGGEDV